MIYNETKKVNNIQAVLISNQISKYVNKKEGLFSSSDSKELNPRLVELQKFIELAVQTGRTNDAKTLDSVKKMIDVLIEKFPNNPFVKAIGDQLATY